MNARFWSRRRLRRAVRSGQLVLTFDDGPSPILTKHVADLLQRRSARATFFLLGSRAERHPEIVDSLSDAGHDLGCHTYSHLNAWRSTPSRVRDDVERGYISLSKWVPPNGMFRPPFGKWTPILRAQLRRRGASVLMWTHDSGDTTADTLCSPSAVIDEIVRDRGGVVLMHDFDRQGEPSQQKTRAEYVLHLTEGLLCAARRHNMRVVTASALIRSQATA